jgi:hypothetical protein
MRGGGVTTDEQNWGRSGPTGMAWSIEKIVKSNEALSEIRRSGVCLRVTGDEGGVELALEPPAGKSWPLIVARVTGARWWQPEGMEHANRLATRLSAELRMKWDRWVAGG